MERVAFLVDDTGERVDCLINPETFEIKRLAGIRPRPAQTRLLTAPGGDDQLLFTGGGRTEVVLDLLFDVDLVESNRPADVRALTARLWRLAENSGEERGSHRPPQVRLVWGKSWNLPGVVVGVAERLDAIDATGVPRRSWLRMKLVRTQDATDSVGRQPPDIDGVPAPVAATPRVGAVQATGSGDRSADHSGVRFDLLAAEALGDPQHWRALASHNDISNPLTVPAGTVLTVPGHASAGGS